MRLAIMTQYYLPEIGAPQLRLSALAREAQLLGTIVRLGVKFTNSGGFCG